jgi:hypothetical protein
MWYARLINWETRSCRIYTCFEWPRRRVNRRIIGAVFAVVRRFDCFALVVCPLVAAHGEVASSPFTPLSDHV